MVKGRNSVVLSVRVSDDLAFDIEADRELEHTYVDDAGVERMGGAVPVADWLKAAVAYYLVRDVHCERIPVYRCQSCRSRFGEPGSPLYECSRCGEVFSSEASYTGDGTQCPDCHLFGRRAGVSVCPSCDAESLVEYLGALCKCHNTLHVI